MSKPTREQLERKFLAELPPNATEAEKAVYVETNLYEYVTMVISRIPFEDGFPGEDDILESVTGIRKRTVENRLAFYSRKYPEAHIALFSTSDSDGLPIYIHN